MPNRDLIVVGASAGGVEALIPLVQGLPPDLPAAILIVIHFPANGKSILPYILTRSGPLQAVHAKDGEVIVPGRIYVAPPDLHLVVKRGYIHLVHGPKENSARPAVDVLFRTAAQEYGPRVIGVVLSGALADGTAGLSAIKRQGGVAVVQNPDEALFSGMPRSAIEHVNVDHILPTSDIAPVLVKLAHEPVEEKRVGPMSNEMEKETNIVQMDLATLQSYEKPGTPSNFSCPECGGVLQEIHDGKLLRFRCQTGHAYMAENLLAEESHKLEEVLWSALRAFEEKAELARRLASAARESNHTLTAARFEVKEQESQQRAAIIRQLLRKGQDNSTAKAGATDQALKATEAPLPNVAFDVVALAASAGGLRALSQVLSALPPNFPAAMVMVLHLEPQPPSLLPDIQSSTSLRVKQAEVGDSLHPGTVYIAPPNKYLLTNPDGTLSFLHSELVQFVCPSADLLFESVATNFKERAIAVVLTGTGSDGALGVQVIKKMGGKIIAQDSATSEFFGMPSAAIDTGSVDFVRPLNEIASTLVNLVIIPPQSNTAQ